MAEFYVYEDGSMERIPPSTNKLKAGRVYLGDNGRAFCANHAGMTARYTGRDLSGQKVSLLPKTSGIRCETCYCISLRTVNA